MQDWASTNPQHDSRDISVPCLSEWRRDYRSIGRASRPCVSWI